MRNNVNMKQRARKKTKIEMTTPDHHPPQLPSCLPHDVNALQRNAQKPISEIILDFLKSLKPVAPLQDRGVWFRTHDECVCLNSWELPGARLKLSTGVSFNQSNGRGGFGGLIRDASGKWLTGYYGAKDEADIAKLQLWSIYRGLTIIHGHPYHNVTIETDSKDAIDAIMKKIGERSRRNTMLGELVILLEGTNSCLKLIPRGANKAAECLAEMGANQPEDLLIMEEAPVEVKDILLKDIVGKAVV